MASFLTNPQQVWDRAVRVRRQSEGLREQLACLAEGVAEVEEQCAAIHDAIAAQAGPLVGAGERAERARRFAAVERAIAEAYRLGTVPPEVAWETLRPGQPSSSRPAVRAAES